ncbi:hypothetical protein FACS189499_03320 [Clostridia bacterium]|nr:hypothetical protein FACS189499_03320 [Clostridia bacterium]
MAEFKQVRIKLATINDLKSFVNIVSGYEVDFDIVSGRYTVDAKSLMGLISLDLSNPLELRIYSNDTDDILSDLADYVS